MEGGGRQDWNGRSQLTSCSHNQLTQGQMPPVPLSGPVPRHSRPGSPVKVSGWEKNDVPEGSGGKNDVPEGRSLLSSLPSASACTCHSPGHKEHLNNRGVPTFLVRKSQARTLVLRGTLCLPHPAQAGWLDYCTPKAKAGVTFQNLFASGPALSQVTSEVW